jgi:hypothetical protein
MLCGAVCRRSARITEIYAGGTIAASGINLNAGLAAWHDQWKLELLWMSSAACQHPTHHATTATRRASFALKSSSRFQKAVRFESTAKILSIAAIEKLVRLSVVQTICTQARDAARPKRVWMRNAKSSTETDSPLVTFSTRSDCAGKAGVVKVVPDCKTSCEQEYCQHISWFTPSAI